MNKHGCYNQPRPVIGKKYTTWNGEEVEYRMSTECKYDKTETDKNCAGCVNVKTEDVA